MKKLMGITILALLLAACGPAQTIIVTATPNVVPNLFPNQGGPTPFQPMPSAPQTVPTGNNLPTSTQPQASVGVPNFDHIILIVLENTDFATAMDNSQMPHFVALAQKYVLLSNYFAASHPSVPNYLALVSGSTQGITNDCTSCYMNQPNLADEIDQSGRTWKAYMESMPSPCFIGNANPYAQKHNPFLYFNSIRLNAQLCDGSEVPLSQLDADLNSNKLPNFSFIMPNLCNSGHDCSVATADTWLNDMVSKLQSSTALGLNSLIIVTFDEAKTSDKSSCCGLGSGGGKVATVLISPLGKPGFTDDTGYSHYSLLKTILTAWNLPSLGKTTQSAVQPIVAPWASRSLAPVPTNTP